MAHLDHAQLLRSVENGSVTHLAKMATIERYPNDTHDGAIVLRSVLHLLDTAPTPTQPQSFKSPPAVPTKEALQRIFGWMDILDISIRKVDPRDKATTVTFSKIYMENLHIILRWLKFYLRDGAWALAWLAPMVGERLAAKSTVQILHNLNTVIGSTSLSSAFRQVEDVVDLLLTVWIWQDENGKAIYLSYPPSSEGRSFMCPTIQLFTHLCMYHDSQRLVLEKLSVLKRRDHDRFMQATLSRMEQWRPPPHEQILSPVNGFDTLLFSVCGFLSIHGFTRSFVKLNIAGNALRLARAYGDIDSSSMPFASRIGYSLFHAGTTSIMGDLQHRIITQLLGEGLLDVLLDDMFARYNLDHTAYPFQVTDEGTKSNDRANPFLYLAQFCIHRAVCEATRAAICAIPEPRMKTLEEGWAAQYWRPFSSALRLYECIWSRIPNESVVLCDNFKVCVPLLAPVGGRSSS